MDNRRDALKAHLCTKYSIAVREDDRLALLWRFASPDAPTPQWVELARASPVLSRAPWRIRGLTQGNRGELGRE